MFGKSTGVSFVEQPLIRAVKQREKADDRSDPECGE